MLFALAENFSLIGKMILGAALIWATFLYFGLPVLPPQRQRWLTHVLLRLFPSCVVLIFSFSVWWFILRDTGWAILVIAPVLEMISGVAWFRWVKERTEDSPIWPSILYFAFMFFTAFIGSYFYTITLSTLAKGNFNYVAFVISYVVLLGVGLLLGWVTKWYIEDYGDLHQVCQIDAQNRQEELKELAARNREEAEAAKQQALQEAAEAASKQKQEAREMEQENKAKLAKDKKESNRQAAIKAVHEYVCAFLNGPLSDEGENQLNRLIKGLAQRLTPTDLETEDHATLKLISFWDERKYNIRLLEYSREAVYELLAGKRIKPRKDEPQQILKRIAELAKEALADDTLTITTTHEAHQEIARRYFEKYQSLGKA